MPFVLYNTLTRSKQEFTSIKPGEVGFYTCGPTVYNYAHIGNMRAYVSADLLRRYLQYGCDYSVKWVMNITDIDDKTIRDSKVKYPDLEPKEALKQFTEFYTQAFFEDLDSLNIPESVFRANPRATHYVHGMQDLIGKIHLKGFAKIIDGSVFFDVHKWHKANKYGKLLNLDLSALKTGTRSLADETDKDNLADFVLWKSAKQGEPSWDLKLNNQILSGRPGWHIECSVMEKEIFDLPFDIHSGGVDLIFPHHEDEIAQSACGYGCEPTNYFMHNEHLLVDGKKMSKSAGNFYTLRQLTEHGFTPETFRFFLLQNHYRKKLNLSFNALSGAATALEKIRNAIDTALVAKHGEGCLSNEFLSLLKDTKSSFEKAMNDDVNTPVAMAVLHEFFSKLQSFTLDSESRSQLQDFAEYLENIFGVRLLPMQSEIPGEIINLAEERKQARINKDWALSDELRDRIANLGYAVRDEANNEYRIISL